MPRAPGSRQRSVAFLARIPTRPRRRINLAADEPYVSGRGSLTAHLYTGRVGSRTYRTEAVVLRSLRFGEADRILHLFTKERGRVGAIAKGARRARSRFGGRLEPFSRVDLQLHEGRGELATVTGVDLLRSHQSLATDTYLVAVGSIGLEAMLRLFVEHDASPRAYHALARFLELLDGGAPPTARASEPALDPLVLGFQLKLLWLAGYLPHLGSCAECGAEDPLVAFSAAQGGGVCRHCSAGAIPLSASGFLGVRGLLERPLAGAHEVDLEQKGARETLRVIEALYEYHGGFRLRTLAAG
jgi:DNA repair protein RecO (recombination protein O)